MPRIDGGTVGDLRITAPGGKPDCSERERSSQPGSPPDDAQACNSHQLSAAAGDAPHPAEFSRLGVLDVLSSTTPRPSGRKRRWARHLADLATKTGEKCRLGARRFRLTSLRSGGIRAPPSHQIERRSGEACALRERGPLGRDIAPDACVRSDCPAQRFPAVVRQRPEPRHALNPNGLSA